jgi:hypothetical protein
MEKLNDLLTPVVVRILLVNVHLQDLDALGWARGAALRCLAANVSLLAPDVVLVKPVLGWVVEDLVAVWLIGEDGPLLEDRSVDGVDLLDLVDVKVGCG